MLPKEKRGILLALSAFVPTYRREFGKTFSAAQKTIPDAWIGVLEPEFCFLLGILISTISDTRVPNYRIISPIYNNFLSVEGDISASLIMLLPIFGYRILPL